MTPDEFRELALALPGAVEGEHMRHPDFRAHGRIFATLAYPSEEWGMVKLNPTDQKRFVEQHGQMFTPVKGAWGLQGSTSVRLAAAQRDVVAQALDLAWQTSAADAAAKAKPKKTAAKKSAKKAAAKKTTSKSQR
jgi:hypothetical protein